MSLKFLKITINTFSREPLKDHVPETKKNRGKSVNLVPGISVRLFWLLDS